MRTQLVIVYSLIVVLGLAQEKPETRSEKISDRLTVNALQKELDADERFKGFYEALVKKLRELAQDCSGVIYLTREEKQTTRGTRYTLVQLKAEKRVMNDGQAVIRSTQITYSPALKDDEESLRRAINSIKSYLDCREGGT